MVSENEFLLHSLIMGIFINIVYDVLRIIRRVIPHSALMVSVEDFGFWVYCGAEVFLLMYRESNGTLRWFAVFGALIGMIIYKKTISPLYVRGFSFLLNKIIALLKKILSIIGKPFRLLEKRSRKVGKQAISGSRRAAGLIKKRLTAFVKLLKITVSKH